MNYGVSSETIRRAQRNQLATTESGALGRESLSHNKFSSRAQSSTDLARTQLTHFILQVKAARSTHAAHPNHGVAVSADACCKIAPSVDAWSRPTTGARGRWTDASDGILCQGYYAAKQSTPVGGHANTVLNAPPRLGNSSSIGGSARAQHSFRTDMVEKSQLFDFLSEPPTAQLAEHLTEAHVAKSSSPVGARALSIAFGLMRWRRLGCSTFPNNHP